MKLEERKKTSKYCLKSAKFQVGQHNEVALYKNIFFLFVGGSAREGGKEREGRNEEKQNNNR